MSASAFEVKVQSWRSCSRLLSAVWTNYRIGKTQMWCSRDKRVGQSPTGSWLSCAGHVGCKLTRRKPRWNQSIVHKDIHEYKCFGTGDIAVASLLNQNVVEFLVTTGNNSVSRKPPRATALVILRKNISFTEQSCIRCNCKPAAFWVSHQTRSSEADQTGNSITMRHIYLHRIIWLWYNVGKFTLYRKYLSDTFTYRGSSGWWRHEYELSRSAVNTP